MTMPSTRARTAPLLTGFGLLAAGLPGLLLLVGLASDAAARLGLVTLETAWRMSSAVERHSLAPRLGVDLPVVLIVGAIFAAWLSIRKRGTLRARPASALAGLALGLLACAALVVLPALAANGDVPTFGLRSNSWWLATAYYLLYCGFVGLLTRASRRLEFGDS